MLKLLFADRSTTSTLLWILVPCFAGCACLGAWCPDMELFSFPVSGICCALATLILWYALRLALLSRPEHSHL